MWPVLCVIVYTLSLITGVIYIKESDFHLSYVMSINLYAVSCLWHHVISLTWLRRNSNLMSQLEHTLKMIDTSLAVSSAALLPFGKRVKQLMCQAVPHGSKKHAEVWEKIQR
jgi:hypothetical protein